MDVIFNNPIASMYGPYFLMFYSVFVVAVVVFVIVLKKFVDSTNKLAIPKIANDVDPYEISYLRGEESELARSVIFNLVKNEYLEFSETKVSIKRTAKTHNIDKLSKIEKITLQWLGKERSTKEIFETNGLVLQLKSYGMSYEQKLESQHLLVGDDISSKMAKVRWLAMLTIAGLGFYKAFAAVYKGNFNIIFLIIIALIGFIVVYFASQLPRISKLGKIYLQRLQYTFGSLKTNAVNQNWDKKQPQSQEQTTFAGVDPMLLSVSIFGGGILAGTAYNNFNLAFKKSNKENHYNEAGCDAGCGCGDCSSTGSSSWSSCDSSSSCSSCSSCGGGCGGCGGCS